MTDTDSITNLKITNRKLSDQGLQQLIRNEDCTAVTLDSVRPDKSFRRAVALVISSRGRNDRNDGGALYFVTDMQGHIAKLYMSVDARRHFGSKSDEGALVILINPIISSNTDRGYTLVFSVERQKDIIVVGNCASFGRCVGIRKDGKPCSMPVDTSFTSRCPHHPEGVVHKNSHSDGLTIVRRPPRQTLSSTNTSMSSSASTQPSNKQTSNDVFERAMAAAPVIQSSASTTTATRSLCGGGAVDLEIASDDTDGRPATEASLSTISKDPLARKNGSVVVPQESKLFSCAARAKAIDDAAQRSLTTALRTHSAPSSRDSARPSKPVNSLLAMPSTNYHVKPVLGGGSVDVWGGTSSFKQNNPPVPLRAPASGDELKMMGCGGSHSVLLNMTNLQRNASLAATAAAQKKRKQAPGGGENKATGVTKICRSGSSAGGVSADKLAALLSRESSHAEEAKNEWFEGFQTRMAQMEKQEARALKDEEIKSVTVRASQCVTCGSLTEYPLPLCKQKGHVIQTMAAMKRFYECGRCGRRDSTLGTKHLPQHRCPKCNGYEWASCGKNKSGYIVGSRDVSDPDHRLIKSSSADSSRADLDRAMAVTSSLDYTAK